MQTIVNEGSQRVGKSDLEVNAEEFFFPVYYISIIHHGSCQISGWEHKSP